MVGLSDFAGGVLAPRNPTVPGPGAYPLRNTFGDPKYGKSGPYKSIGLRQGEKASDANQDVGPGRYEVKGHMGEGPKYSFSPRATESGESTPSRRRQSTEDGGQSETKKSKRAIPAPPPDLPKQWNMSDNPTTPRYSLGAKTGSPRRAEGSDGPGPGQYTPASMFGADKKAGVSLASRYPNTQAEREISEKPGPGHYDVDRFADKAVTPQLLSMPHTVPQPPERPGPGSYETHHGTIEDSTSLKHPRVSQEARFGARHKDLSGKNRVGPGPGGYDATVGTIADTARRHNKGPSMSARNLPSGELEAIYPKPGPGEYTLPSMFQGDKTKGVTMSPRREPIVDKLQVPGPGKYDKPNDMATVLQLSKQGVRFNGGREFQADGEAAASSSARSVPTNKNPGPGQYTLPGSFDPKGKGCTFGAREAKSPWATDHANAPGPGTYTKVQMPATCGGPTFYKGQFTM